jgi:hypothetical protein
MVRLLNETNYIFDQAPSYVCDITNIIFCDETMACENTLLVLLCSSGTIDYFTKGPEYRSVIRYRISVLNRCVS